MTIPNLFRRDLPAPLVALLALVLGPIPLAVLSSRYGVEGMHVRSTPDILGALLGVAYGVVMIILSMRVLHSDDARCWFGVVMILGMVMTGPSLIRIVNMNFDQSTPFSYTAEVLEIRPPAKHSGWTKIRHWEADEPPITLVGWWWEIGSELTFIVHQGRLGFPWIEPVSPTPSQTKQ